MSVITRHWNAMTAAYQAYRAYIDPSRDVAGAFTARATQYDTLWAYYTNSVFERVGSADNWALYRNDHRLYPYTRSLYNPVRRLVNFYTGTIYPGVLATDGKRLPEGVPLAIPITIDEGNPQAARLLPAIGEVWRASNWQSGMRVQGRYAAALGSCLTEIVEEPEREKVCLANQWPGRVYDLDLNPQGDVQAYDIRWRAQRKVDGSGKTDTYEYRKVVDGELIEEFEDDVLKEQRVHGYGFCPAIWTKFRDEGSDHGAPAIAGSINKIDELNSLMSRIHWQIARVIESPQVIATSGVLSNAIDATTRAGLPEAERDITLIKGPADTSTHPLAGNLDLDQALPYAQELIKEIEKDHPELGMYNELRAMSQVTGPGASRLLGDVYALVNEVASNSDQQAVKGHQMSVAIWGERIRSGQWRRYPRHREVFAPFGLDSYDKGELDHEIAPRPLVPITQAEQWTGQQTRFAAAQSAREASFPAKLYMPALGWDDGALELVEGADEDEPEDGM
jgi:hypothetical protein